MDNYPWAHWPWQRCWAYAGGDKFGARCDLRKDHGGMHIAERGLGADVCWTERYEPSPLNTPTPTPR